MQLFHMVSIIYVLYISAAITMGIYFLILELKKFRGVISGRIVNYVSIHTRNLKQFMQF